MFKLKSYSAAILVLVLVLIGGLAGCASTDVATSAPVEPTDAPSPTPADPVAKWEQMSTMKSPTSLRMAAFIDPDTGISGGPNAEGIARVTSDGGKTWTEAGNSSQCLWGLDMIDADTIWECNTSDLRVTTDGGKSWTDRIRGRGSPGCKLSAIDDKTAWVVSPSEFLVTHDGGETRESLPLPDGLKTRQIAAISFRSETEGYILDAAGQLHATVDGGNTWETMPSPDLSQYGEMALRVDNGQPYAAIRFFDAERGLLALSLSGGGASKLVILRTGDGGQAWDEETIDAPYSSLYLSRDGKYLTAVSAFSNKEVVVFRYTGQ